jgi:hypothetical protein
MQRNSSQYVVEIVRSAGSKLADGFEFLRSGKSLLSFYSLGLVSVD